MRKNSQRLRSVAAVTVLVTGLLVSNVSRAPEAQYLEIRAEIVTSEFGSQDTNIASRKYSFDVDCILGIKEWRVEETFCRNAVILWHFDGTNVFQSSRRLKPADQSDSHLPEQFRAATIPFEKARSNITIRVSLPPDGSKLGDEGINIPWLAYCSGGYLNSGGSSIPLVFPEFGRRDTNRTSSIIRSNDELGLPMSVEVTSREKPETVWLRYRVIQWTNCLGWSIPALFEVAQYKNLKGYGMELRYRGVGTLKTVKPSHKPEGLFAEFRQTIVDRRFFDQSHQIDSITYKTSANYLMATNSPELLRNFEERKKRAQPRRSESNGRGRIVCNASDCGFFSQHLNTSENPG